MKKEDYTFPTSANDSKPMMKNKLDSSNKFILLICRLATSSDATDRGLLPLYCSSEE